MMYGYQPGWGWMMLMPLVWVAVVGVLAWAAVRLLRRPDGDRPVPPARETPREILDRRFASGEIDAETYAATRDELTGHRT